MLDELHTYRGRQGANVAMLVRRVREEMKATRLQCVGTSATLAGGITFADQQREVAAMATRLFGADVLPEQVIGETLQRVTPERDPSEPTYRQELTARVAEPGRQPPAAFTAFREDPLSAWIESTFGLEREPDSQRLRRAVPLAIDGADGGCCAPGQGHRPAGRPLRRSLPPCVHRRPTVGRRMTDRAIAATTRHRPRQAAGTSPPAPNEVRQALPPDFSGLLERNKEAFATATSREDEHASTHRQGEANAAGSRNRIRAKQMRRYHGGTDDDDEHIRNAIQLLTAGSLPKPAAQKVAAALKRGVAPPRVRGIRRRDFLPWFCQSTRAQRTHQSRSPREGIRSSRLVAAPERGSHG